MASESRKQLEAYLKTVEIKGGTVLDIGGAQNPLKGRLKVFEPKVYKIADLPVPHESKASVDAAMDISKKCERYFLGVGFDNVFCIEVMEYVSDPVQAVKNLYAFTKPGGHLYISFHFLYPIHPPTGSDYFRYTRDGAIMLLKEQGFKIEHYQPRMMNHFHDYMNWIESEGYRYDRSQPVDIHGETGCIIKAKR